MRLTRSRSCALRLLSTYPSAFLTGLSPPPAVYLISPWSPPLPATDPLAYRQPLDWIPDALISTQDKTLPYVIPALKNAEEAYGTASKAVGEAMGAVKSWWGGLVNVSVGAGITDQQQPTQPTRADDNTQNGADLDGVDHSSNNTTARSEHAGRETIPMPEGDAINAEAGTDTDNKPRTRLWAPSAKYVGSRPKGQTNWSHAQLVRSCADAMIPLAAHNGLSLRRGLSRNRAGAHALPQPWEPHRAGVVRARTGWCGGCGACGANGRRTSQVPFQHRFRRRGE